MRLTIEGTPEELREKRSQLLKALVSEFRLIDPDLADVLQKADVRREPQLKYRVLRQLQEKATEGYKATIARMLEDVEATLQIELPPVKVTAPAAERLAKVSLQKAPTGEASTPETAVVDDPVDFQNRWLWAQAREALLPTVVMDGIQKADDESGDKPEPGEEPPDPDYDEESGEPKFDPKTGLTPSETKEAKESGELDDEGEGEGDEETALSERPVGAPLQKGRVTKRNPHGGPFIGPRGGLWADPKHTIHWDPATHGEAPVAMVREAAEKEADSGERYDDAAAIAALTGMGDRLYAAQAGNPYERDVVGFSRNDMQAWHMVRGDLFRMRKLLEKYRRQLLTEAPKSEQQQWWKAGLGDKVPDLQVTWKYHERFGSLNIKIDGYIKDKDLWWRVHEYMKGLGMWRDKASGYYVLRDPGGFDFAAFKTGLQALLPDAGFPAEALVKPPTREERDEAERQKTEAALKNVAPGASPVDAVWQGLRTGDVTSAVGMKWHEDEGTFEFRFPKGAISALFSNKRGMLPSVTMWDQSTQPWNVKVWDVEIAKLAIARIKELKPNFKIVTEGLEDAEKKRDVEAATKQAPIPEVVEQLGIDPQTGERFALRPFQNEGTRFLLANDGNALLGDEMGLGKTIQYLAYAVAAKRKAICIGPKSVRRNWVEEGARFFPGYFKGRELDSAELLKAQRALKKRLGRDADPGEIAAELGLLDRNLVAINYESVEKFRPVLEWLAQNQGFNSMVVDESHRMKNPKAQLTKAIQKLRTKVESATLMSGTSIKNEREEFYTQVNLIRPGEFKMRPYRTKWGTVMRSEIKDLTIGQLWDRMRPFYLSRAKEVVLKDLPPRVTSITKLETDPEMTPDLASTPEKYIANERFMAYAAARENGLDEQAAQEAGDVAAAKTEEYIEGLMADIEAGMQVAPMTPAEEEAGIELSAAEQLQRILFDKSVGTYQRLRIALAQAKAPHTVAFVKEMLENSERNVLIFTESKAAVRRLKEGLGDVAVVHTGDESQDERERVKALFHAQKRPPDTKERVLILTTPSAREGITLTAADMVVFNDLPFTAADLQQAEARAHRLGQANKVNVYWMHADHNDLEDMLTGIVQRKLHLSEQSNKGRQIKAEDREWMDKDITPADIMNELRGKLFGRGGEAPKVSGSSGPSGKTVTTQEPTTPETATASPLTPSAPEQPVTPPAPKRTPVPRAAPEAAPPVAAKLARIQALLDEEYSHLSDAEGAQLYRLLSDAQAGRPGADVDAAIAAAEAALARRPAAPPPAEPAAEPVAETAAAAKVAREERKPGKAAPSVKLSDAMVSGFELYVHELGGDPEAFGLEGEERRGYELLNAAHNRETDRFTMPATPEDAEAMHQALLDRINTLDEEVESGQSTGESRKVDKAVMNALTTLDGKILKHGEKLRAAQAVEAVTAPAAVALPPAAPVSTPAPAPVAPVHEAGGPGVEPATPAPGKVLWTTDSDVGRLEQARVIRRTGDFDQRSIWEWEWLSGPNKGKRESSYSHSFWTVSGEAPPASVRTPVAFTPTPATREGDKSYLRAVAGGNIKGTPGWAARLSGEGLITWVATGGYSHTGTPYGHWQLTPAGQQALGAAAPETAAVAAAGGAPETSSTPTVAMTNEKAAPRLAAMPREIVGAMRNLHAKEKAGQVARVKLTPNEAKRLHDWMVANGGVAHGPEAITWSSPAGSLTWRYERMAGEYGLSYTSQTAAVWEGPEPDADRVVEEVEAPTPPAPTGPHGGAGEGRGQGGLSLAPPAKGQLALFKAETPLATLAEVILEDGEAGYRAQNGLQDANGSPWRFAMPGDGVQVPPGGGEGATGLSKGGLSDPLTYDHTATIADEDERRYDAVRRALVTRGAAIPTDFELGGRLYGASNNELVSWLETLKAANGGE